MTTTNIPITPESFNALKNWILARPGTVVTRDTANKFEAQVPDRKTRMVAYMRKNRIQITRRFAALAPKGMVVSPAGYKPPKKGKSSKKPNGTKANRFKPSKPKSSKQEVHEAKRKIVYQAYMEGPTWKVKRLAVMKHAGFRCEICAFSEVLNVHHYNYRRLGNETLNDLFCLCRQCHQRYHSVRPVSALPKDKNRSRDERLAHIARVLHPENARK